MAQCVYLHIGAPKSGTTFLQTVLWKNKDILRDVGFLVPGDNKAVHNKAAAWARATSPGAGRVKDWTDLRSEIDAWPGHAILSCEWFTMVPDELIPRLMQELEGSEIHVVFTARSAARTVPAAWQERLKLGDVIELSDMLSSLEVADNERWNWGTLDPARVLKRWAKHIPRERVHLVTVPPSGSEPSLLWTRFTDACKIPEASFDLDGAFANESLSAEAARLLELMGPALLAEIGEDGFRKYRWVRNYFSHSLLAQIDGHKIALLPQELDVLDKHVDRSIAALEGEGFDVVGDLRDLKEVPDQSRSMRPDDVSNDALVNLASAVIPPMLGRVQTEYERANRERKRANANSEETRQLLKGGRARQSFLKGLATRARTEVGPRLPSRMRDRIRGLSRR